MAIAIGPNGITSANANATTVTVSTPTVRPDGSGLVNGDLFVMVLCSQVGTSSGAPAGWTRSTNSGAPFAGTNGGLIDVFYRYRDGAEASTYAPGMTTSRLMQAFIFSVTGAIGSGDPIETGNFTDSGANGATINFPSITPTLTNSMLICICTAQGNVLTNTSSIATISGMTEALDFPTGTTTTRKGVTAFDYLQLASNAATGAKSTTISDSAAQNTGVSLSLKTAVSAGPVEYVGFVPIG